jgi:hypothetical protein
MNGIVCFTKIENLGIAIDNIEHFYKKICTSVGFHK